MKLNSLTHEFLENLARTVNLLNSGVNKTDLNPTTTVFSAFSLTIVATFSSDFRLQMLILSIGFCMILLTHSRIHEWAKVTFLISLWAIIVTIPSTVIMGGETLTRLSVGPIELRISREGINAVAALTFRVLASTAILISFTTIMGWRRIILGLEGLRVPNEVTSLFKISIINMPFVFRDASRMLSAREARVMKKMKFRELWMILSTVVGEILVRGFERAWHLEKSIKARSFAGNRQEREFGVVTRKDYALLSLTIVILAFWALEMW